MITLSHPVTLTTLDAYIPGVLCDLPSGSVCELPKHIKTVSLLVKLEFTVIFVVIILSQPSTVGITEI